jgi:PPOX class probable F420-dependent enzyme
MASMLSRRGVHRASLYGMPYNHAPDDWWKTFVDASPAHTAKLAVVRSDGAPQVAPVWIIRDGEQIVFMTGANTVKGKSILRDGRVSLCIDNEKPPFDFLTINGTTTTSTDPHELLDWSIRIAERYMGADQAEAYGRRNAVPPEMVVRVTPTKIIAVTNVAD